MKATLVLEYDQNWSEMRKQYKYVLEGDSSSSPVAKVGVAKLPVVRVGVARGGHLVDFLLPHHLGNTHL